MSDIDYFKSNDEINDLNDIVNSFKQLKKYNHLIFLFQHSIDHHS